MIDASKVQEAAKGEINKYVSIPLIDVLLPSSNIRNWTFAKYQPGVNFINVLRVRFLYKSALRSFFLVTFWLWQTYESTFVRKTRERKMFMKLTLGA